jgi:hypothetical protein
LTVRSCLACRATYRSAKGSRKSLSDPRERTMGVPQHWVSTLCFRQFRDKHTALGRLYWTYLLGQDAIRQLLIGKEGTAYAVDLIQRSFPRTMLPETVDQLLNHGLAERCGSDLEDHPRPFLHSLRPSLNVPVVLDASLVRSRRDSQLRHHKVRRHLPTQFVDLRFAPKANPGSRFSPVAGQWPASSWKEVW